MSGNILTSKGYSARVEFDADDGIFFGDIAGFHADTVSDLVAAFHEAVDDYGTAIPASARQRRYRTDLQQPHASSYPRSCVGCLKLRITISAVASSTV